MFIFLHIFLLFPFAFIYCDSFSFPSFYKCDFFSFFYFSASFRSLCHTDALWMWSRLHRHRLTHAPSTLSNSYHGNKTITHKNIHSPNNSWQLQVDPLYCLQNDFFSLSGVFYFEIRMLIGNSEHGQCFFVCKTKCSLKWFTAVNQIERQKKWRGEWSRELKQVYDLCIKIGQRERQSSLVALANRSWVSIEYALPLIEYESHKISFAKCLHFSP